MPQEKTFLTEEDAQKFLNQHSFDIKVKANALMIVKIHGKYIQFQPFKK